VDARSADAVLAALVGDVTEFGECRGQRQVQVIRLLTIFSAKRQIVGEQNRQAAFGLEMVAAEIAASEQTELVGVSLAQRQVGEPAAPERPRKPDPGSSNGGEGSVPPARVLGSKLLPPARQVRWHGSVRRDRLKVSAFQATESPQEIPRARVLPCTAAYGALRAATSVLHEERSAGKIRPTGVWIRH
jgi:hypothetical protein